MEDLEFIIVNDGTKDNSQKIINEFVLMDKRFKSFIKTNGGLSDARNYGIERASGEYISFLDSDDWLEEDFCEKTYTKAKKENADIVFTNINVVNTLNNNYTVDSGAGFNDAVNLLDSKELIFTIAPHAWGKIYLAKLFKETDIRYPKGLYYEDIATTFSLLAKSAKNAKVAEPLINYFVDRPNNITSVFDSRALHIFEVLKINNEYFKCYNIFDWVFFNSKATNGRVAR